jgi:hypothetical protein
MKMCPTTVLAVIHAQSLPQNNKGVSLSQENLKDPDVVAEAVVATGTTTDHVREKTMTVKTKPSRLRARSLRFLLARCSR